MQPSVTLVPHSDLPGWSVADADQELAHVAAVEELGEGVDGHVDATVDDRLVVVEVAFAEEAAEVLDRGPRSP
jgi:hypothetical protein